MPGSGAAEPYTSAAEPYRCWRGAASFPARGKAGLWNTVARGPVIAEPYFGASVAEKHFLFDPVWMRFAAVALIVLALGGCRQGVPVIDTTPGPAQADGTISGTVRGPEGTSPIEGRAVVVVNVATGERQQTTTNNAGGFTFKVKPGKYQVELPLRDGEVLVKKPSIISVNRSDVDAHADFVLGIARVLRPRAPHMRGHDGLGAPSA